MRESESLFVRKWWREGLTGKLAVIFLAYIVIGVPSSLYIGASVFENTPASASLAVSLFFILWIAPIFALPLAIAFLEVRGWFRKRNKR